MVWGVFVAPASEWYSASVPVIVYIISYNIGPRYNGTQLCIGIFKGFSIDSTTINPAHNKSASITESSNDNFNIGKPPNVVLYWRLTVDDMYAKRHQQFSILTD